MSTRLTQLPPLPARLAHGHKGTFGTVCVLGGCCWGTTRMIGAPALAALGALRAGCGLARLFMPAPILDAALVIAPSCTGYAIAVEIDGGLIAHEASAAVDHAAGVASCLVVGPGLGAGEGLVALALRAVQQHDTPVVIDADALNALASVPELARDLHAPAIFTPHPGEYARLAGALGIDADATSESTRPGACEALAQRLGGIVVLKGAGTVVSDGLRTWVHSGADSALATAGTGDVLAGVIASLVAQFVRPHDERAQTQRQIRELAQEKHRRSGRAVPVPAAQPGPTEPGPLDLFGAACLGVEIHALGAELWRRHRRSDSGMLASELCAMIPEAVTIVRDRHTARPRGVRW